MTTYGPDPDVPTAGVLPVDDCVIAPPVTATSTVFRTPNCPTIRWEASRCREPSARAFAVKGALRMDSRVIGDVHGTALRSPACCRAAPIGLNPALRIDSNVRVPSDCRDLIDHEVAARRRQMEVRFIGVGLAVAQGPRICSEADVKRGYVGGRQRLWGESQLHRRPACLRRRCHPHQAQLDWIPTASRCSST